PLAGVGGGQKKRRQGTALDWLGQQQVTVGEVELEVLPLEKEVADAIALLGGKLDPPDFSQPLRGGVGGRGESQRSTEHDERHPTGHNWMITGPCGLSHLTASRWGGGPLASCPLNVGGAGILRLRSLTAAALSACQL